MKLVFTNGICISIDRLVQKKVNRCTLDLTTTIPRDPSPLRRWISLRFLGRYSNTLDHFILRPSGFRPTYYNLPSLGKFLVNLKDKIPRYMRKVKHPNSPR